MHPSKGEQQPFLQVSVEPVEYQDEEKVKFKWTPVSQDEEYLTIKIDFDAAFEISTYEEKNYVELVFNDPFGELLKCAQD